MALEYLAPDEIRIELERLLDEASFKLEETEEVTEKSHWGAVALHVGIAIEELDVIERGCEVFDEEDLYDYGDFC